VGSMNAKFVAASHRNVSVTRQPKIKARKLSSLTR
jgi:hypothetical protein